MAYNSAGTYTALSGAETAVAGNLVQSAVWDAVHADFRTALTQSMQGEMGINGFRNSLAANGGFEVWQRGAGSSSSFTVNASDTAYTADRWYITTGANQQYTVAAVAGLVAGSKLACAAQRVAAQTGTGAIVFGYPLDANGVARLRGKKVSLNFYASTGANWSPASGTFTATLYVGTGAVQKAGAAAANFTGPTTVLQISTNLAAASAATNITGISAATVPATATQGELQFSWTPVGTAGGADTITFDDVQLEASDLSTNGFIPSYERLPIDVMLNMCKRHYRKTMAYGVAPAQAAGLPGALSVITQAAAQFGFYWQFEPIALRATGSVTTYNPNGAAATWQDITTSVSIAVTVDASGISPSGVLFFTGVAASAAAHQICIHAQVDSGI